ncbi:MAG: hypothetical protein SGPRY_003920 [Prymnesium sp.]
MHARSQGSLPEMRGSPTEVPFFVISLSKERADAVIQSLQNLTTHLEHVPGVQGKASARNYAHDLAQYKHLRKRNTPSELGCALSHVLAIRRAEMYCESSGCQMAAVVEDDVSADLLPHWSHSIRELTQGLPDNWAVCGFNSALGPLSPHTRVLAHSTCSRLRGSMFVGVQLQLIAQKREWSHLRAEWRQSNRVAVLQDRRRHFGTGAYLIHRRGMQQIKLPLAADEVPPVVCSSHHVRTSAANAITPAGTSQLQADVHLVYSLAAPVYLATPPLLSCKHAISSVEHFSAIRLQVRGSEINDANAPLLSDTILRCGILGTGSSTGG